MSEQRYKPYGEVRWSSGAGMPTDFTFTSQRAGPANYVGSPMDYVARGYSPALGRFVSADTIVPGAGNPQAFNRYMYVLGNPLGLRDPSGHSATSPEGGPSFRTLFDLEQQGYFESCYRTSCFSYALVNALRSNPGYDIESDTTTNFAEKSQLVVALWQLWANTDTKIDAAGLLAAVALVGASAAEAGDIFAKGGEAESGTPASAKQPVIIGEDMAKRIRPYAESVGGKTINDWIPSDEWTMQKNAAWIEEMKSEGRVIVDIGPNFPRRLGNERVGKPVASEAYGVERKALVNYPRYSKVFSRSGRFSGGVSGLDEAVEILP